MDEPQHYFALDEHRMAPLFMVPFDRAGNCTAPNLRARLLDAARQAGATEIVVCAHGWNSDWKTALGLTTQLVEGLLDLRRVRRGQTGPAPRPLFVGAFWPSATLVAPWEQPPQMAGGVPAELALLAELLPPAATGFWGPRLSRGDSLTPAEARELAGLVASLYSAPADPIGELQEPTAPTADELLAYWREAARLEADDETGAFGFAHEPAGAPRPAGGELLMLPRTIARWTSVWAMKDRAGAVGAYGVGPLIADLLRAAPEARVHLVGHSFGCKVLLSALSFSAPLRPVSSLTMLQPAVSRYCFAASVAGGGPGGYRVALDRVVRPVISSFSARDVPLRSFFHLAARRSADLGEARIAGPQDSLYGALGGYGPSGCDELALVLPMPGVGELYPPSGEARLLAVNGTAHIGDHGDVTNPACCWALYSHMDERPEDSRD